MSRVTEKSALKIMLAKRETSGQFGYFIINIVYKDPGKKKRMFSRVFTNQKTDKKRPVFPR